MKKVITHGYNKFTETCDNCRCFFEYELEDVIADYVTCPDCGARWRHHSSHYVCGAHIKEQNDESRNSN